jgi:hypothetical protein
VSALRAESTLRHAIGYLVKYMMRPDRNAHSSWPTAAASTGPNKTSFRTAEGVNNSLPLATGRFDRKENV